jgi:hypothetical protein
MATIREKMGHLESESTPPLQMRLHAARNFNNLWILRYRSSFFAVIALTRGSSRYPIHNQSTSAIRPILYRIVAMPRDGPLVLQEVKVTLHQKLIRKASCNSRGLRVPFNRPKVEFVWGGGV